MKSITTDRAHLEQHLRESKLKITPQRINMLEVFEREQRPLKIKELAEMMDTSVDMVTLYRNVDILAHEQVLVKLDFGDDVAYYEIKHEGDDHHHLTCTQCGYRIDVEHDVPQLHEDILRGAKNFASVTHHSLEFFGVCKACAKK